MDAMPFEPMSVGQILDRTFSLYRSNFARFLAVVGVVYIPIGLISIFLTTWIPTLIAVDADQIGPGVGVAVIVVTVVGVILMILAQTLANGALLRAVSEAYLGGDATIGECYSAVLPRVLTLLIAGLLVGLLVMIGLILCIVPGVILALLFSLTASVIVVEGAGAVRGMSRSKALVSGNLGKVFAVNFVVFLIAWIVGFGAGAIGQVVARSMMDQMTAQQVVSQIFQTLGQLLALPISSTAVILLYYDLRIRKEGFDLEMLAQSMRPESELPPSHDT